jgi:hypothetical protein
MITQEEFMCIDNRVEVEREHTPRWDWRSQRCSTYEFDSKGIWADTSFHKTLAGSGCASLKDPSPNQRLTFVKQNTLLKRIHHFWEVQKVYMPAVRGALSDHRRQIFDGNGEQLPEAT